MRQKLLVGLLLATATTTVVIAQEVPATQTKQEANPEKREAIRPAPTQSTEQAKIDPKADAELRKMSDYLAGLQSFRVQADSTDEVVLKSGQKIEQIASSRVEVKRPDKLRSERVGPVADVTFRYDGKQFSIEGHRMPYYATAPAPAKIDDAIDEARDKFGLEAPGADLIYAQPYEILTEDVTAGTYVGLEPVGGVMAHHLAFQGNEVDWQIWIQDGDKPLPLRYVITSKKVPGQPEFTVQLSKWEPDAKLADSEFAFKPKPGTTKIQLLQRGGAKDQAMTKEKGGTR